MKREELKRIKEKQNKLYQESLYLKKYAWTTKFDEAQKIRDKENKKYKEYVFLKNMYEILKGEEND